MADCVIYYLDNLDDDHSGPEATHVPWLIEHFGGMTCSQVNIDTCRAYVTARTSGAIGHKLVKEATAKRELETLSAALNRAWKAGKLDRPIAVWKPGTDEQEARWLTRDEAARLLRGALGFTPRSRRHRRIQMTVPKADQARERQVRPVLSSLLVPSQNLVSVCPCSSGISEGVNCYRQNHVVRDRRTESRAMITAAIHRTICGE